MNEREHPAEAPTRVALKSLLKKPGQTRGRGHKNRVVINEKLNEFFAADYIILIKEECCADYEEECDCCCQEPEMIRLGSCKECRADLTRNLGCGVPGYGDLGRNGGSRQAYASGLDCDPSAPVIRRDNRQPQQQPIFGSEESQEEDDEEEEDEEEMEDEEEEEEEEEEEVDEEEEEDSEEADKCGRDEKVNCNMVNCVTPMRVQQQQQQQQLQRPPQQQETLSPPEGYKDVCDEDATLVGDQQQQQQQQHLVCGECNYYHRQRSGASEDNNEGTLENQNGECREEKEVVRHGEDNNEQQTSDQAQQTTPDLHQRYLVETITMTTVTERRIVREISEEETTRSIGKDETDAPNTNSAIESNPREGGGDRVRFAESSLRPPTDENTDSEKSQPVTGDSVGNVDHQQRETNDPSELSLTFKLGGVSLGLTNSLKPNSAVRQLFPDPRFISPPPAAPTKALGSDPTDDDDGVSEAQRFLITTESLRLFDAVKRSKMAGSRSDSSESESSSVKRTIERNALRRSLICKYETTARKRNLRSKDLTLEERIRQLTCVDQDDDCAGSSASETGAPTVEAATTTTASSGVDAVDYESEFPVRTSPSGEERPRSDSRISSRISSANNVQETTTTLVQQSSTSSSSSCSSGVVNAPHHHQQQPQQIQQIQQVQQVQQIQQQQQQQQHHHHHHHHHHQSTYKRITDLFTQKKPTDANLPDLGLGDRAALAKEYTSKSSLSKMNSDARKQFLASLAPLSCVASTDVERGDYYQVSSKQIANSSGGSGSTPGNRDSIGYNSDSSYSLEDIEAALRGEERNNCRNSGGPPDVTRGTPTGSGPETCDATTDELLAFVEQDRSRTERIRRRYNDSDVDSAACSADGGRLSNADQTLDENSAQNGGANEPDDDDDELNDYGFNRRPSVRGIKPQFESTSEIVRQLRSRSAVPSSIAEKSRASFHGASWPYYEIAGETSDKASTTFLLAAPVLSIDQQQQQQQQDDQRLVAADGHRDTNTINRINTMQKQIDDIYQTIAETAVTVQGSLDRGSYLDTTLPRTMPRGAISDSCHRYSHQEQLQLQHSQKNGVIHYHDPQQQQQIAGGRMLRIAGGGDGSPGSVGVYNTLPTKSRRPQTVGIAGYPCSAIPQQQQTAQATQETTKCYRTMYLVPYSGISDPTYQNIQRILPPHSSANYADHIERYPYPRNGRVVVDQQIQQQQHQQMVPPLPPQQQQRYYSRPVPGLPGSGNPSNLHSQPTALHLHLQPQQQPDDYRYSTAPPAAIHQHPQTLQHHQQQQQQQHLPQMSYSGVQTLPTYSILGRPNGSGAPGQPSGYAYPTLHPSARAQAADVQTQTTSLLSPQTCVTAATTCGPGALLTANYNGAGTNLLGTASSSSSNSSALSSPTKILQHQQQHQQRQCNVAEQRGVPEGAASAPSHDYGQTNNGGSNNNNSLGSSASSSSSASSASSQSHGIGNAYVGHGNNVPPPNTQNSVYYAMNV